MRKAEGMQKAMLGLQKIMGDLKKEAYDALEPLRQPEFAQFSLDLSYPSLNHLRWTVRRD